MTYTYHKKSVCVSRTDLHKFGRTSKWMLLHKEDVSLPQLLYVFKILPGIVSLPSHMCHSCGLWPGDTQVVFVPAGVGSGLCMCQVVMATRPVMLMNTISIWMGGQALTSPKGGSSCSLGTLNYGVVGHLAFRINLNA